VSFSGDPEPVFTEFVTQAERDELEKLRKDYAELVQFKANAEASQLQAQKDAVFAKEKFASIVETKSFKKLVENSKDYSVEECEQRANDILEDFNSFAANFSAQDEIQKPKVLGFNVNKGKVKPKKPYGNLFADK
jgi:translation initiation factor IF-2